MVAQGFAKGPLLKWPFYQLSMGWDRTRDLLRHLVWLWPWMGCRNLDFGRRGWHV